MDFDEPSAFEDLLNSRVDDPTSMDTSYLDIRARSALPAAAAEPGQELDAAVDDTLAPTALLDGPEEHDDLDPDIDAAPAPEPAGEPLAHEDDLEAGRAELDERTASETAAVPASSGAGVHGGAAAAGAATVPVAASQAPPTPPAPGAVQRAAQPDTASSGPSASSAPAPSRAGDEDTVTPGELTPVSLRTDDHQDAVQSAGARGGSNDGAATAPDDQVTPFKIAGAGPDDATVLKKFPKRLVAALRLALHSAAMSVGGLDEPQARRFSGEIAQTALVTAFLAAQLDLHFDADPSTSAAQAYFQGADPLMGSLVERLTALEAAEQQTSTALARVQKVAAESSEAMSVVEHGIAYLIADRTENLARQAASVADVPFTAGSAIRMRDKARADVRAQLTRDRLREGRPM